MLKEFKARCDAEANAVDAAEEAALKELPTTVDDLNAMIEVGRHGIHHPVVYESRLVTTTTSNGRILCSNAR